MLSEYLSTYYAARAYVSNLISTTRRTPRTVFEKTSMLPKSVCVVSVDVGPRSLLFGMVSRNVGAEEVKVRVIMRWEHCFCIDGREGVVEGREVDWRRGRRVEEALMVSVARRERRRGRVGGCGGIVAWYSQWMWI